MAEPHVISALIAKRAELDGECRQTEKRLVQLRADLDSIDGAIRVFDPSLAPRTIRPKLKRKPPSHFRHVQFSRAVLDTLRRATEPLTVQEIATRIASEFRADVSTTDAMNKLITKTRGVLASKRAGLANKRRGDAILWRAAD